VLALWAGSYGAAAAAFILTIILARSISPAELGFYFSVIAILNVLTQIVVFGLPAYFLKVFVEEGYEARRWLKPSIPLMFSGILVSFIIYALYSIAAYSSEIRHFFIASILMLPYMFGQVVNELSICKLQLEGNFRKVALIQMVPHFCRFVFISLALYFLGDGSITGVSFGVALGGLISVVITVKDAKKLINGEINLSNSSSESIDPIGDISVRTLISGSQGYFSNAILFILYSQINLILINTISTSSQAGIYGTAFSILLMFYLAPTVLFQKYLMPKYHYWMSEKSNQMNKLHTYSGLMMLSVGTLLSVFLIFFSSTPLFLLFGPIIGEVYPILAVISLGIPFRYLATSSGAVLNTKSYINEKIKLMLLATSLAILLGSALIYFYGAMGAAFCSVIVDCFLAGSYFYKVKKILNSEYRYE
jgi:O-antigen/teichoic acid export membrane protein